MGKATPATWVIGPMAVLLGALVLSLCIRMARLRQAMAPTGLETEQRVEPTVPQPVQGVAGPREATRVSADTEEPNAATAGEAEESPTESEPQCPEQPEQESDDAPADETIASELPPMAVIGAWRDVWADLNLTDEEQTRLREGFRLVRERWQNMSEEQRQAEIARLREMGARWQRMSESERLEASRRVRERFEQWRRSGEVELPELTLD
jgi:hypothetical protein